MGIFVDFLSRPDHNIYLLIFYMSIPLFIYGIIYLTDYKARRRNKRKTRGLEAIPGPKSLDFTGIIGNFLQIPPLETSLMKILRWADEYGDIIKVYGARQTWICLNSGANIKTLLQSNDLGHIIKSPYAYGFLKPFMHSGILVSNGKFWQHERKIVMKSQTYHNLKAFIPILNKHSLRLVSSLENRVLDGNGHQVHKMITFIFIKVMSEMITGFDNDDSDEYVRYYKSVHVWKESISYRFFKPWLFFKPIWNLDPMAKKFDAAVEEMNQFAHRRVRDHQIKRNHAQPQENLPEADQDQPKKFRTLLDELVDNGVEGQQIIEEINSVMFGGHDTGAGTVHFLLFMMALYPNLQSECQREIDELFDSYGDKKEISYDDASGGLKYLERCLLETLRLYPPAFMFIRKITTPLTINYKDEDLVIPPGTNIIVSPFLLQRRNDYFPNREKFDPDRFLPDEVAKRHPYSFIPFSAGPRNCMGLKFAMIEMKVVAAHIMRNFTITTKDKLEDLVMMPFSTITPKKDFTFNFEKRFHNLK